MPFYSDILSHLGSPASGSETIIAIPRLISSQSHSLRSSEYSSEPVVSRNPLSSLLLTDDKDGLPYKDKENPCLCSLVLGMLLLVF
ncbi:uncharacterized protein LOC114265028 isoform X6 [Camellia sinensis]|uniref:uncharacterized protein LOC114265028 isoform X6 n=1 Tax=Camellia sinensis TaxID=4442 RepID=UPI001036498C|nr:uncharacterized protein LOC114265028 isoform X6 [Camellia sinensis]